MSAPKYTEREMRYFLLLSRDEQAAAIRRLAATGATDYMIAAATRLAVEQIRRVLADREVQP